MLFCDYRQRLRIWETNYGRDCGWIIERKGDPIAILSDPLGEDMFSHSYRLEILTHDSELRNRMVTTTFWLHAKSEGLVWRNREFPLVAEYAFPSLSPLEKVQRLFMRGLFLPIGKPRPRDKIVLALRRIFLIKEQFLNRRCLSDTIRG